MQLEVFYNNAHNLTSSFYYFAQNAFKCWFTGEMFASYRKSGSLNPFPWPELELMHLLRVLRSYRHKIRWKQCCMPEITVSVSENGCTEFKYDVRF